MDYFVNLVDVMMKLRVKTSKLKYSPFFLMLLILSITLFRASYHLIANADPALPVMYVEAPNTVNASETKRFNVTVWLESSETIEVIWYQIHMTVNDSVLGLDGAWIPEWNSNWIFYGKNVQTVNPAFGDRNDNDVYESVKMGSSLIGVDTQFVTGSVLLAVIQFRIVGTGPGVFAIDNVGDMGFNSTYVMDPYWEEINIEKQGGQVNIVGDLPAGTSEITIEVNPPTAVVGQNVTITGQITPQKQYVDVKIEQKIGDYPPELLTTVETNETSWYTYECSFSESGAYLLKAKWDGDETHQGSTSDPFEITVTTPDVELEIKFADLSQFQVGDPTLPLPTPPATMNVTIKNVTDLHGWNTTINYNPYFVSIDEVWLPTDNVLNLTGLTYDMSFEIGEDYLICEANITETGDGYTGNGTLFQFSIIGITLSPRLEIGYQTTALTITSESLLKDSEDNQIFYIHEAKRFLIVGLISTSVSVINLETGDTEFLFYSEETSVNTRFNATIRIDNATDLFGCQLKLTYDPELLNAIKAVQPVQNDTYIFYGKTSEVNYTLEDGVVWINDTLAEGETAGEDGFLTIIEFEILRVPTNETGALSCSLTLENIKAFDSEKWQTITNKNDGEYTFRYGARPGDDDETTFYGLEYYWPYIVGLVVLIVAIYIISRLLKKRREKLIARSLGEEED